MGTFRSMRDGRLPGEVRSAEGTVSKKKALKQGEKTGILLASVLFVYALFVWDIPLASFLLAFIVLHVHIWIERTGMKRLRFLSNILKGFSITLLIGSIVMVFF